MNNERHKSFSVQRQPRRAELAECQGWLPVRAEDSHKGSNGRVLIAGGEQSMAGAACLAGWSAYNAGAGLVRVATIPGNVTAITSCRPELLVSAIVSASTLKPLLRQIDTLALGPGLGQTAWSRSIFEYCLEHATPNIVDADGLNLLADTRDKRADWILTPHPGEAARLLDCQARDIQADRLAAASEIVHRYGGICILKGHGSLVVSEQGDAWLCPYGNAALAVAGTGDVLTGLLAALLAQGMRPVQASVAAVVLHASAADRYAAEFGNVGMLASELMGPIRKLRNQPLMKNAPAED